MSLRHLAAVVLLLVQGCSGGGGGNAAPDTTPPTVPAGLVATTQSSARIHLAWQASTDAGTGVAGYRIYRDGGATPIATVTVTSYQDDGLTAATTYSYTVRAFDGASPANVSAASAAASAMTAAGGGGGGSGLDTRPANPDCVAGDAPASAVSLAVQRVFPNLSAFSSPILMLQEPGATPRWFVAQKGGIVYAFGNQANVSARSVFINLTGVVYVGSEAGLLGMAFHPDWPTNPRAYLSITALTGGGDLVSRIVEYQSQDGGGTLATGTAKTILQVSQPEENHNGGHIAFGPDGYLYFGLGDGGGGGDQHGTIGNGQRLSTLLGKMLRIDVNGTTGATPYAIPEGNPFKYSSGTTPNAVCNNDNGSMTQNCPEIYAYGLRNPWRWSFDSDSKELWLGDVGQGNWEEVNRIVAGGNYGWRCHEGNHDFNLDCGPGAAQAIRPVAEYAIPTWGNAVTGGHVYRGSSIPALVGRYVFGDYASGNIWHIARDTAPTLRLGSGFGSGRVISSFAQDSAGEIYIVDYVNGLLYRLVAGGGGGRVIPTQLSATGCVNPADPTQPAAGLIPFVPNAPFWSDGASKTRWLALPDGVNISVNGADGDFDFPEGAVLMKNFRLGSRLIETRLFMRHNDGNWAGYTYEWNQAGTDATRVVGGKTVQIDGQDWNYPSELQCLTCHTAAAGRSLGLELAQLNGPLLYPQTGRTANQLTTLNALGMLSPQLTQPAAQLPAIPDPFGVSGTLGERARAWLHTNCAQCHRPGGPTPVDMDLRYTTPLASTNACDVVPVNALGVANARRIAIGSNAAARSLVVVRPGLTNADSMPPFQPRLVDAAGVQLLTQWVNSLASCN